jgi:hypothetical protein
MKTFFRWLFPKSIEVTIGSTWEFNTKLDDDPFAEEPTFQYKVIDIKEGYAKLQLIDKATNIVSRHTSSKKIRDLYAFYIKTS